MSIRYFGVSRTWDGKLEVREFDTKEKAINHCELCDFDYVEIKDKKTQTKEYQQRIKKAEIDIAVDEYIKKKTKHIKII